MTPKTRLLFIITFILALPALAQDSLRQNPKFTVPDIPGYITLKADFHMHTVFSDGHVWPSFRVWEANQDGLDVISITEHIDFEGFPEELEYNRERAFEIASEAAAKSDLLVIRGVEISPRVAPYHNNAIFLKDVDALSYDYMKQSHKTFVMKENIAKEELMAPFQQVKAQGGFVFYNHPSYNWWDKKDPELFTPLHQELLDAGILGGVEVVNSGRYNLIAHRLAEKYNLTMFGNTDVHYTTRKAYETQRPMTLVFATAKTPEAVEEAIRARRTLVYSDDYLVGRQQEAEAFFKSAIELEVQRKEGKNAPKLLVKLTNTSDIPYDLRIAADYIIEDLPLGRLTLEPKSTAELLLNPIFEIPQLLELAVEVENILVSPEKALRTSLSVKPLQ